jgi:hypothetical protein
MNNKLIKWAAIGGGAWLLYRYLVKPSQPVPSREPESDWSPRLPDTQEEVDYWMGRGVAGPKRP